MANDRNGKDIEKEAIPSSTSSLSNRSKYESYDLSGSVFLIGSNGVISLPMPSRSPRDPLNWGKFKRGMAFISLACFSVIGLVLVQGASMLFGRLMVEFPPAKIAPLGIDILISGPTLFMGIGAFLWIPLTLAVGRRTPFLLANVLVTIATMWAGMTKDFHQLLAAVCLIGLAEGFATSAILLMIMDLTFIHQRPDAIAMIWSLVGAVTLAVFSLVPQMSASGQDRNLFYLLWFLPCLISILLAYFFYPETYFIRPPLAFNGRVLVQSSTEKTQIYDSWDEVPGGDGKELPDLPERRWFFTRPEYALWRKTKGGWRAMGRCYLQVALCVANPLIFWVALLEALVFSGILSMGTTYAITLQAPPYNLSSQTTAFVNLAAAFGSLLAWPASGCLIAHTTNALAMRNKGVREAEHYLPAFILPVIFSVGSLFLYGATVSHQWHAALVYLSYGLNSFAFTALATANTLWVTEAFPRWAAPAIVVVNGLSYIASFGTNFAIRPWIRSQGMLGMEIELGLAVLVTGCVGLSWAFWGRRLRGFIAGRWAEDQSGALRPM